MRRLAVVATCLLLAACASTPAADPGPSRASAADHAVTSASTGTAAHSSTPATTLADGVIPTDCAAVSEPELLARLGVASSATGSYTDPAATAMPTSEAQATEEDRTWPGLGCLYASAQAEQEATILVMPDTSPFLTNRQTTTCLPTYGRGRAVALGTVTAYYCPTTNESPAEWVSFAHHGRLVTVSRTSLPTGDSPYSDVLIAYATWLSSRL